jgi:hypothetical protein
MSDIVIDWAAVKPKIHAKQVWRAIAFLMLLGLWSDAATLELENSKSCGLFTIGVSEIGGCDVIAPNLPGHPGQ